jgi:hypothetical protein
MNLIKMRHPNLEAEIEVPESAVPIHMASGWMPVEDSAPTSATSKPKATAPAKDKE